MAALATPAMAANDAMMDLINIMEKKGTLTKEEADLLRGAAKADDEVNTEGRAEIANAAKTLPKITVQDKIEIASPDGAFKWKFGGRIHADTIFYDDDDIDISSGTQFRRARLDVDATLYTHWAFKFQYDFTDTGRAGIRDMWIRWNGWKPTSIIVGNYKMPFSLEELTSSNDITFMERSLANTFAATLLSRRVGIGASTVFMERATLHASILSNNATAAATAPTTGVDEGWGIAGRGTFVPYLAGTNLLHLGVAGAYIGASQDRETQAFSSRPETGFFSASTGDTSIVSTGALGTAADPVDDFLMFGVEAAGVYGPASLQGEYVTMDVGRSGALSDLDFDGYYIEGSYFLTGESRPYDLPSGSFKSIKPKGIVGKGGLGAWQLALRYSSIDLTDGTVVGGEADNFTAGLNWYPTPNLKFMANYMRVLELDRPGDVQDGDEPSAFMFRAQAYW
jgi:phosphate-selective porin OprO/OprP